MLIATFDDANWKKVQLADGSNVMTFEEPDHLKTPPEVLARNQKRMLLLTLPITCRKMLDERKPLDADQISSFLDRTKDLIGFDPDDNEMARIPPVSNAALGTIAVLFVLHREWLQANPREEEWCLRMLDHVLSDPPQWSEFDLPESVSNYDWEHFACDIAPVIWAEAPANRHLRERIAQLAFAKHYGAASILFTRAFERRSLLGSDLWQLMNLMLDWAAVRYDLHHHRYTSKTTDFEKWAKRRMKAFTKGKYATDFPRWGQQSVEEGRLWSAHNSHPRYLGGRDLHLLTRIPRLDLRQVQATFKSVLLPSQATSDWERERFLQFWDEALRTCLAGTQFFDEKGNGIDPELVEAGSPYEYDRWVLERLTIVIAQMRAEEQPERYWKPILRLGAKGQGWVDHFLTHWFMNAKRSMNRNAFVREWTSMLNFCLNSESWVGEKGRTAFDLPALWLSLVGLPRFVTSLWQDEDAPIVAENGTYFVKVATHILNSAYDSVRLLSWLAEPSAKGIRRLMLRPIADTALVASDYWWKEEHIARVIAQFVSSLIEDQSPVPAQTAAERMLLLDLVHKAANTQEPLAMELQAQMASREI